MPACSVQIGCLRPDGSADHAWRQKCFRLGVNVRPSPRLFLLSFVAVLLAGCGKPERRYLDARSNADNPPGYAFSGAVLVGDTLYISGHLGLQSDNKVPADPAAEARLVLDQVKGVLAKAGMTMDDLVQVQITCTDLSLYATFNGVYKTYFEKEFPARAFLGTDKLLFGARFEVLGIAVKR